MSMSTRHLPLNLLRLLQLRLFHLLPHHLPNLSLLTPSLSSQPSVSSSIPIALSTSSSFSFPPLIPSARFLLFFDLHFHLQESIHSTNMLFYVQPLTAIHIRSARHVERQRHHIAPTAVANLKNLAVLVVGQRAVGENKYFAIGPALSALDLPGHFGYYTVDLVSAVLDPIASHF